MENEIIEVKLQIDKKLWEEFKEAVQNELGSKKVYSGKIGNLIKEYLKNDTPTNSNSTHTHKATKGVSDVLEWIEENNPKGITKDRITQAIKDVKGYDIRTVQKYEPIVLQKIQENGFRQHPNNPNLFIRYEL